MLTHRELDDLLSAIAGLDPRVKSRGRLDPP